MIILLYLVSTVFFSVLFFGIDNHYWKEYYKEIGIPFLYDTEIDLLTIVACIMVGAIPVLIPFLYLLLYREGPGFGIDFHIYKDGK